MNIPKHIGFIMDGNRRWAKSKGLEVIDGHFEGIKRVKPTIQSVEKFGVSFVSFFALSEDNLLRDPREVNALMKLFREFFSGSDMQELMDNGVKVSVLGRYKRLPFDIVNLIEDVVEKTKDNKGISVQFALSYDGAIEILHAAQALIDQGVKKVTKENFTNNLYSKGEVPDLDLVIRTGGENRLSGFLLWQTKYSEYRFVEEYWPEYTDALFQRDIAWFMDRDRRFGK